MPNVIFNDAEDGGLTKLEPEQAGGLFAAAHVRVVRPATRARREEFTLANVSGQYSRHYGDEATDLVWRLTGIVNDVDDLRAWEQRVDAYRGAGRYIMQAELDVDDEYADCELVDWRYEQETPQRIGGTDQLYVVMSLRFRWMNPGFA